MTSLLTIEERDDVVVILRCAADCQPLWGRPIGLVWAIARLGFSEDSRPAILAWQVRKRVHASIGGLPLLRNEDYRWVLLEAAQRVEDGTWP